MNLQRGDVSKPVFPHAAGGRGKKRPVVRCPGDGSTSGCTRGRSQVTANLADQKRFQPCLFVEAATPKAKAAGFNQDCLISLRLLSGM